MPAAAPRLGGGTRSAVAAVLVMGAALFGLRGVTARGPDPDLRSIAETASRTPASGRVWFAGSIGSRPGRDTRTIRSLLDIRHSMAFGDFIWNDVGVPAGPSWVRVDLRRQVISLFRGGNEIATAVIIYGAQNKRTPLGRFTVLEKHKDYRSITYDAAMPFAMFLTRGGVAIHAGDVRSRNATHGCIGVPIAFARRLYAVLKVGDPVDIIEPDR